MRDDLKPTGSEVEMLDNLITRLQEYKGPYPLGDLRKIGDLGKIGGIIVGIIGRRQLIIPPAAL